MSSKDLAIGTLSLTAAILFGALMLVNVISPQQAMGIGQNASAGDYVVTTAQLDDTSEVVCVLNTEANRMVVYGIDVQSHELQLVQQVDVQPLLRGHGPRGGGEREPAQQQQQ